MLSVLTDSGELGDQTLINPRTVAETLGMPLGELASVIGVSRNSLSDAGSPKVQASLRPLLKILAVATDMSGATVKAVHWFKYVPLPSLGFKTAMELVADGKADSVMGHFENVRNGVYS
jgi:hypothetical protein